MALVGIMSQSSEPAKLMHLKSTEGLTTEAAGGSDWVKAWTDGINNLVENTLIYCPKLVYDPTLGVNVVYFNGGYLGNVSRLNGGNILNPGTESFVFTMLIKKDIETTRNYVLGKYINLNTTGDWYYRIETTGQSRFYMFDSANHITQGTTNRDWKILTMIIDKQISKTRIRENLVEIGGEDINAVSDLTNPNSDFWLGVYKGLPTSPSYNFHGAIAEIIVHRDLTKIEYFEQQIKTKYGL